jgi:hypothetical protein
MNEKITVEDLTELCKTMFIQKELVAKLKAEKTVQEKILSSFQDEIIEHLEVSELKTFDTGFGKVSRSNNPYAKIVDKGALTVFLKERGIFEDLVTFNAATMNSFYKEEMEKAKKEMNLDFKVDGMDVSSNRVKLSITGVKL